MCAGERSLRAVGRGSAAHLSGMKPRHAQGKCLSGRRMGIGCALVGGKAEMVAVEVEKLGSIDDSYSGIFLEIIHQKPYIIHKHGLGEMSGGLALKRMIEYPSGDDGSFGIDLMLSATFSWLLGLSGMSRASICPNDSELKIFMSKPMAVSPTKGFLLPEKDPTRYFQVPP